MSGFSVRLTLDTVAMVLILNMAGVSTSVAVGLRDRDAPADDCLAVIDGPGLGAAGLVECTDCDPACDRDGIGTADGMCVFRVAVCLNQGTSECAAAPLRRVRVRPRRMDIDVPVPDDFPPGAPLCGRSSTVVVPTRRGGRKPGKRRVRVAVVAGGAGGPRRRARETVELRCLPRPPDEACPASGEETREACAARDPLRQLFFGDLHIHTAYSFDAWVFDVRTTPRDAYRFARGEALSLPPLDAEGRGTQVLRLERPLDFAAVTDHSEFLGEVDVCTTPGTPGFESASCETFRAGGDAAQNTVGVATISPDPMRLADVCGTDGSDCIAPATSVWQRTLDAAEAAYDRSATCAFTTFAAYEYTANTSVSTLHRNVIFRTDRVPPVPVSYIEEPTPQGLWAALRGTCLEAGTGCDALAIPHNSNESNGNMFEVEYPGAASIAEEREQAAQRAAIEPLMEVYQHKGDSECMNGLSGILGATDELCDFEKRPRVPFQDCGDGTGAGGVAGTGCFSRRDFLRGALLAGMAEAERLDVNPFRLGVVGGTDTHNGTPGAVEEADFIGHRGGTDDTAEKRLGSATRRSGPTFSPGGLTAIWAEENTRASLFDALRRREVYATSGPRIAVRFFGGAALDPGLCDDPGQLAKAYETGVPMGATLPAGEAVPRFLVTALADPGTVARPGALLERLQIVKLWIDGAGEARQAVFDVAGSAIGAATVDPATCAPQGPGSSALCAVWDDPTFEPTRPAAYYARVIENPTCRWNAHACNALPPESRPAGCDDPEIPRTVQERAWTSPIWYEPGGAS
ncbi:MAG TPA: DUF3604 domain-containing protein [Candidatus Limnocylindria bacterium]|nr:DUF3604 domain-containing protein [Candidatus Limnocylindria bacterium]